MDNNNSPFNILPSNKEVILNYLNNLSIEERAYLKEYLTTGKINTFLVNSIEKMVQECNDYEVLTIISYQNPN